MSRGFFKKITFCFLVVIFIVPLIVPNFVSAQTVQAIMYQADRGKDVIYNLTPIAGTTNEYEVKGAAGMKYTIVKVGDKNYISTRTGTAGNNRNTVTLKTPATVAADTQAKSDAVSAKKAEIAKIEASLKNPSLTTGEKNKLNTELKKAEYELKKTENQKAQNFKTIQEGTEKPSSGVEIVCPSFWDSAGDWAMCMLAKLTYNIVLTPVSMLLSTTGRLFNWAVDLFIVEMKPTLGICGASDTNCNPDNNIINVGWTIFRDLANIMFIFVLIYIGIKTILYGVGDTAKNISTIIVIAVLINFSMFFTKVVIDISNVAAISFYNTITDYGKKNNLIVLEDEAKNNIAQAFISQTKISTIHSSVAQKIDKDGKVDSINYLSVIITCLMGAVFLAILSAILLLMTIMITSRFIILAFIIMTSSLAFGAYILPALKSKISDKWWDALVGQSFFAPVFLLFLYITLVFLTGFGKTVNTNNEGFSNMLNINPQAIIGYVVTIGMLILSMKVAKQLSDQAGAASGNITKMWGGAALGGSALFARYTAGSAGRFARWATKDSDSAVGRLINAAGNKAATSTFDLRNLKTFQNINKRVGGVELGESGNEGGMDKTWDKVRDNTLVRAVRPAERHTEERVKEQEKRYKEIGKLSAEEQLPISVDEKRKNLKDNIIVAKNKKTAAEDRVNALFKNGTINQQQQEERLRDLEEEHKAKIEKAEKDLAEHVGDYGDDAAVTAAADAAKEIRKEKRKAQAEYIANRRSKAGREFKTRNAQEQQKIKNPNAEVVDAVKGIKVDGGGGKSK